MSHLEQTEMVLACKRVCQATLLALGPHALPRAAEPTDRAPIDRPILVFTLGCALFSGIVFGLLPALQVSRTDLQSTLKEDDRAANDATGQLRFPAGADALALAQSR